MRTRLQRAAIGVLLASALLLALYALAGFLLVPALVERHAGRYVEQRLGLPAAIGKVSVNPFLFKFDAGNVRVGSQEAPIVAAEHVHVDLELSSFFSRAWKLAELRLDGLDMRAEIAPDGRLNLAQLVPESDQPADEQRARNLVLRHATVRNGKIVFTDRRRAEPASATLSPLDIEVFDLTTLPDRDGRYTVAASLPDGAQLDWGGTVSLQPFESAGELKATRLQAATLWPFVRDAFRLRTPAGTLNASTRYTFSSIDGKTALRLEDAAVHVQGLALVPVGSDAALLKLDALDATRGSIDLAAREFVLPEIVLRGGAIAAPLDRDGVPAWARALNVAPGRPRRRPTSRGVRPTTPHRGAGASKRCASSASRSRSRVPVMRRSRSKRWRYARRRSTWARRRSRSTTSRCVAHRRRWFATPMAASNGCPALRRKRRRGRGRQGCATARGCAPRSGHAASLRGAMASRR